MGMGSFTVHFALARPIVYRSVAGLLLNLNDNQNSTGQAGSLVASLYNYQTGGWDGLPGLQWGGNQVDHPENYVGAGGSLTLRITNSNPTTSYTLTRCDFTLVVNP